MADDDRVSPMTEMRGVGSRPITLNGKFVKATTLGGTVEKLEMGMTGERHMTARQQERKRRGAKERNRLVNSPTVPSCCALQSSTAGRWTPTAAHIDAHTDSQTDVSHT